MIEKKSGIYKITNTLNNRFYIGSATNLYKRNNAHFSLLRKRKHYNSFLQRDFIKSGKEKFLFEVLLYCDRKNLLFYEQKFLNHFFKNENCYNLTPTAGSCLGLPCSNEKKEKLRQAHFGKILSKEHRKNISVGIKILYQNNPERRIKSSEIFQKLWEDENFIKHMKETNFGENNPMYGKNHTEETKKRIAQTIKYCFVHDELGLNENVTQHELKTKYKNLTPQGVTDIIKGRQHTHRGWRVIK